MNQRLPLSCIAIPAGIAAMAMMAASAHASVVFSDTFSASTLNSNANSPSSSSTNYDVVSAKNASGSNATIGSGDLKIAIASTSGLAEAQALFAASPLKLGTVGDSIEATLVFTGTKGILIGSGAATFIGLYNSGSSAPLNTLNNGGISSSNTSAATGGAVGWNGYVGQIGSSGFARDAVNTRAAQIGADNRNQDLVGNSLSGGYTSPNAVVIGTNPVNANTGTNGNVYTQDLRITLSAENTLTIMNTLYNGTGTSGTIFGQSSGTTTSTTFLADSFDGVAFGYRGTSNPEQYDVNALMISANIAPTPEPASLGLVGVGICGLLSRRRRRS